MADDGRKDELDQRIARAKAEHEHHVSAGKGRAEDRGWAVGIEFVGAVLVGGFVGWMIDRWLHIAPIGLVIFLIFGFAAGLRRAFTASKQFDTNLNDDE